jgi:predicted DNA-binding ArsR family transcriptional regulator
MIISQFNPCSSQYQAIEDFKSLTFCSKIVTIAVTIMATLASLPLVGLFGVFAFRELTKRFSFKIKTKNDFIDVVTNTEMRDTKSIRETENNKHKTLIESFKPFLPPTKGILFLKGEPEINLEKIIQEEIIDAPIEIIQFREPIKVKKTERGVSCEIPKPKIEEVKPEKDLKKEAIEIMLKMFDITNDLTYLDDNLQNDPGFLLSVLEKSHLSISEISKELRNNEDFMLKAIAKNYLTFSGISKALANNKNFIKKAIEIDFRIKDFSTHFDDFLVRFNLTTFAEACKSKQSSNADLMLGLIKEDYKNAELLDDKLKLDPDFLLKAVKVNFRIMEFMDDQLISNPEFMIEAVKINYRAMEFASDELKEDLGFMSEITEFNYQCGHYAQYIIRTNLEYNFLRESAKKRQLADKIYLIENIGDDWDFEFREGIELFKTDSEFMLIGLEKTHKVFSMLDKEISNNADYMLRAIEKNYEAAFYLGDELENNPEFLLKAIQKDFRVMDYISSDLRKDTGFMLKVIQADFRAIVYLDRDIFSETVLDDIDFIWKLYELNVQSFGKTNELKYDYMNRILIKIFDPKIIQKKIYKIKNCSLEESKKLVSYIDNSYLILLGIRDDYYKWFELASDNLKTNQEFILTAVEINPKIMQYISKDLRGHSDFALKAIERNYQAFSFLEKSLKENEKFIKQALSVDYRIIEGLSETQKENRTIGEWAEKHKNEQLINPEFMAKVVAKSYYSYERLIDGYDYKITIDERLKNDPDFILKVLENDTSIFYKISEELRNDFSFMLKAVKANYKVLKQSDFRRNKAFMIEAIKIDFRTLKLAKKWHPLETELRDLAEVCKEEQTVNSEFMLKAIKKDVGAVKHLSDELTNDPEFALEMIKHNHALISDVDYSLRDDTNFMLKAFEINPTTLEYSYVDTHEFKLEVLKRFQQMVGQAA